MGFVRSFVTRSSSSSSGAAKLAWLDLRGSGLSAIERLCLEEVLLRHDTRNWAILGTHEPVDHRYLRLSTGHDYNRSCLVVMGIGGKPRELLNIPKVIEDEIMVCKRFTGGGTVVLDPNSLWTTFIGRNKDLPHVDAAPRSIMEWSAGVIFGPAFQNLKNEGSNSLASLTANSTKKKTLVMDNKSCCGTDFSGKVITIENRSSAAAATQPIPDFALRENDYVLGDRKMGGNAQSIIKDGWLHHTSFLWDFYDENMEYLTLPSKRPDYRGDRSHGDFLVKLKDVYPGVSQTTFFASLKEACQEGFHGGVETVLLPEVMSIVDDNFGSLQNWFEGKCRTKIVDLSKEDEGSS